MQGHHIGLSTRTFVPLYIPQWSTWTLGGLVSGMIFSVMLTLSHEILSAYLMYHDASLHTKERSQTAEVGHRILRSLIHVIYVSLSYCIMLSVMTFNVWLMVSVVLGSGIGYYFSRSIVKYLKDRSRRKQGDKTEGELALLDRLGTINSSPNSPGKPSKSNGRHAETDVLNGIEDMDVNNALLERESVV